MALTYVDYVGDGATQIRVVSFPYIDKSHVIVTLDGVATTAFTWPTDGTISLDVAPAAPVAIRIRRVTPRTALVTWTTRTRLQSPGLTLFTTQLLYVVQESDELQELVVDELTADIAALEAYTEAAIVTMADMAADASADLTAISDAASAELTGIAVDAVDEMTVLAANADNSAIDADDARVLAEAALAATLAAYDTFDDRFLGSKASDPTLDNDGDALVGGALYYNSAAFEMRVYTGSAWVAAYVDGTSVVLKTGSTMTGPLVLSGDATNALHPTTKQQMDTALALKSDTSHTHTFASLTSKPTTVSGYSISDAYTISQVDTALGFKAALASPSLTGTPLTPTAAQHTDTTQIASTAFVMNEVAKVPQNAQTGTTYGAVAADNGKLITLSNAAGITVTISSATHAAEDRIDFIQKGAGQVTFVGSGVTINSSGGKLKLTGQYSGATIWFESATVAYLIGDLTT